MYKKNSINKIKKQNHTHKRTKKRSYGKPSNKKNTKHNKRTQKYGYYNKNNKITKKRVYNKKKKVLVGGAGDTVPEWQQTTSFLNPQVDTKTDKYGALILNNSNNNNGNDYCWINAPLYAFVAFEDVIDIYNTPRSFYSYPLRYDAIIIIEELNDTEIIKETNGINTIQYIKESEVFNEVFGHYISLNIKTDKFNQEKIVQFFQDKDCSPNVESVEDLKGHTKLVLYLDKSCLRLFNKKEMNDNKEEYDNVYKIMQNSRKSNTIWNNELYQSIHKIFIELTKNNPEKDIPNTLNTVGNAQYVCVLFLNILTKKTMYLKDYALDINNFWLIL